MRRYITFLSIALLLFTQTLTADPGAKEKKVRERGWGAFQFSFGSHFDQLDGFNNSDATKNKFPEIPVMVPSIGVGGFRAFKNKWILGGEIHYGFATSENAAYRMLAHRAGHLMYTGYVVYQSRLMKVYPIIGWTGTMMILNIHQPVATPPDFNTFLTSPTNATTLYNRVGALQIGAEIDFKLRNEVRSPIIGLRVGYELAANGNWKAFNTDFVNAPTDGVGGFYFKLQLGFINHDKKWDTPTKKVKQPKEG